MRSCGCSVGGDTCGSGRQWERRRWIRICSPRTFQGSHSSFLGRQWVSRKIPLELVVMKCIILKCISCDTPGAGKAGTGTHPGLLCSWRAATAVSPSVCFWQLEIPPGRLVSLWKHVCVKQDRCFCRRLSFCLSQTVRVQMEMSFCVWPQQICPSDSNPLLCSFSEGPGCICRVWYPWRSRQRVPAQSCTNMKGFF